jgi:hypothetical protein
MSDANRGDLSRRRLLGNSLGVTVAATLGIVAPWSSSVAQAGANDPQARVTDAILGAFEKHRLVAMAEAHGLQEFHDTITQVLTGQGAADAIDDIVVEFGNSLHQAMMDGFISGGAINNVDLRPAWQDTTQSPLETWDSPVYEQFFRTVRGLNWGRNRKIRVVLGDPPIDWSKVASVADAKSFATERNQTMAAAMVNEVLKKGHHGLFIAGGDHLFHNPKAAPGKGNATVTVEQETGEKVYVIGETTFAQPHIQQRLSHYPRPSLIPTTGTWLSDLKAGDMLIDKLTADQPLKAIVDAVLYLGQPDQLTLSYWNPAIFLDPVYWAELQRRAALNVVHPCLDHLREERPAIYSANATEIC